MGFDERVFELAGSVFISQERSKMPCSRVSK